MGSPGERAGPAGQAYRPAPIGSPLTPPGGRHRRIVAAGDPRLCSSEWRRSGGRSSVSRSISCSTKHRSSSVSCSTRRGAAGWFNRPSRTGSSRACGWASKLSWRPPCPAATGGDHRRPPGHQRQRPHRPAGPQGGLRPHDLDGRADPGEIVWTWVVYEDDPTRGRTAPSWWWAETARPCWA